MFTRETKIFLIVGFVAILGVSVLFVDHISGSNRQNPAGPLEVDPLLSSGLVVSVLPSNEPRPTAPSSDSFRSTIGNSIERVAKTSEDLINGASDQIDDWRQRSRPAAAASQHIDQPQNDADSDNSSAPSLPGELEMGRPTVTTPAGTLVQPEEIKIHRVVAGDSLWRIAESYYGDAQLHKALAEYNKDRLNSDGQPRAGATLRIPPRALLLDAPQPEPVVVSTPNTRPNAQPNSPTNDRKPAAAPREYVVKKGDTLSQIAQRELGSARRWQEIMELNTKLKKPEDIWVGMKLKLPAR